MGDLVRRGFDFVDRLHVLGQYFRPFPELIDQRYQLPPTLDNEISMGIEQVEEFRFLGHQSGEHWAPPLAKKHADFIS
jgi:hypothetical protein